jgi:hypothetical protein
LLQLSNKQLTLSGIEKEVKCKCHCPVDTMAFFIRGNCFAIGSISKR